MPLNRESVLSAIKAKLMAIADSIGEDATDLQPDDIIPASGAIDSAGLLELIAWFEGEYGIQIPTSDFTIDNLGSMALMADYLLSKQS